MRKTIRTLFAVFLVLVILSAQMLSAFAVIADGQVVKKEIAITHNNLPIYIHHIDGTGEALYCIDHDALSPSSFTIPSGSVFSSPIAYWNALTPMVQQSLRMVLFYAPKVYNDSTKYQCAAAQIIAWEYLSGTRTFTDFRTAPLSYPDLVTSNSTMYTAYQSLIEKIQRHHKIPTINAATITVTGIGEANAVLTNYDENSVLATDWEPVSPDPRVHAEIATQDGRPINRLKVWISEDIGDDTVTISLRHKTLTDLAGNAVDPMASTARWIANYPYEGVPNIGQPLIGGTLPDPITANVKVRAELGAVLKIVKQSSDGNVAGIRFKVEKDEPGGIGWWTVGTYTTDASGEIKLEDRAVGDHFRVTELVPDGYVCESDNPQEITLTAGENTLTFRNRAQIALVIEKQSPDGHVAGIRFKVEKDEPGGIGWWTVGTYTTDANGEIKLENRKAGDKLRVTEIVPDGYICESDNPQEITLAAGGNRLTFQNRPQCTLKIIKQSQDGNIAGIRFKIEKDEPDGVGWWTVGTYTTDASGEIKLENRKAGDRFRVTEIVPDGYVCSSENPQLITLVAGTNTLRFENRAIRGSLRIVKVDGTGETPLQGAGYRLYNRDGEQIAEGYTDENGELVFEDLPSGSYTYQEFAAPEGFGLDLKAYDFAIREDGEVITRTQENQPKEGSITVCKVDENNRPLPGVTFLLEYSPDGETWEPIRLRSEDDPVEAGCCTGDGLEDGKLTTDEDGIAVFSGLCIDTQMGEVYYRITEVSTVPGYSLLSDYAFEGTLSEESEIDVSLTVVNLPEFTMPSTGGNGFTAVAVILLLSGLLAGGLYLLCKKKQEG